ncbi:unnamed protein product [Schistosoma haematobium]|nr:unnamed protein product [Schistosoma haematobium]
MPGGITLCEYCSKLLVVLKSRHHMNSSSKASRLSVYYICWICCSQTMKKQLSITILYSTDLQIILFIVDNNFHKPST